MDIIKHLEIFDPANFRHEISVIGCGATGSATTLQLAKLGLKDIKAIDFDVIEAHNIPNQLLYSPYDVGKQKARVLSNQCTELSGSIAVRPVVSKVDAKTKIRSKAVFFCVDTMAARKEIFENCIFLNGATETLIDMRMSATYGQAIIIDTNNIGHVKQYRETLYSDEDVPVEKGNCGITLSVGPTASLVANFAVWLFMKWVNNQRDVFSWQVDVIHNTWVSTPFDNGFD